MKSSSILRIAPVVLAILLSAKAVPAQDVVPTGIIKGQVTDSETKAALPGVTVLVADTQTGSNSDADGNFIIKNLPVGSYTLKFNCMGYHNLSKTDIIVKPKRIVFVQAELEANPLQVNDVVVSNGYFPHSDDSPTSFISFSAEEIRRAPGSAGDVSRILMTLPSVAKVNDMYNSLIVRGGSPNENGHFEGGGSAQRLSKRRGHAHVEYRCCL